VLDWFRRIRKVSQKLTLPSRDSSAGRSQVQLNPQKLTPSEEIYLGQLSYLSVVVADLLEQESILAPNQGFRESQLAVAKVYRSRHQELTALLAKLGQETVDAEDRVAERIDELFERTAGVGWHEAIMRLYLVIGILEHSALETARGLSLSNRNKVEALLKDHQLADFCHSVLSSQIQSYPEIAGRLAMYGRSLVADVLLEVRNSVSLSKIMQDAPEDRVELSRSQFKALEPFTSALIAAHTVRMDRLGLTA
jgi:hypothetical protein